MSEELYYMKNIDDLTESDQAFQFKQFDCGYRGMNEFLNKEAIKYSPFKFGTTTLVYKESSLVGYFTLRSTSLLYNPDGRGNRCLPAIEIFRIAVAKDKQNKGIGTYILKNIITGTKFFSDRFSLAVGILVNSDKDCIYFYKSNHFNDLSNYVKCLYEPYNGVECVSLFLKL